MKDHKFWRSIEGFAVGKGFYIVLALCVAAVGATGYYLLDTVTDPLNSVPSINNDEPVVLPDEPVLTVPEQVPTRPVQQPVEVTVPDDLDAIASPDPPAPEQTPTFQHEQVVPTVFTWPVKGEILRDFSVETLSPDPTMGDWRTHAGLDVAARLGTRVLCMTEGTVSEIWEDSALGTCVRVEHGGKLESVYANLSPQPTVNVGDHMEIGAILGAVGTTAQAEIGMEPHLHLEVFRNGKSMDPMEFLPEQ